MVNDIDFEMAAKRLSEIEEYHKVERVFIRLNNARSVDAANRKVIDFVLNKKPDAK